MEIKRLNDVFLSVGGMIKAGVLHKGITVKFLMDKSVREQVYKDLLDFEYDHDRVNYSDDRKVGSNRGTKGDYYVLQYCGVEVELHRKQQSS